MRLFELSEKLHFYFYILQSVEILSGTVVTGQWWIYPPNSFLRRLIFHLKFAKLWRVMTSQFTLKRTKMQTSNLDYQYSNNTIIFFATQYKYYNIAVSGGLALLRAYCRWKTEHQIKKCCVKGLILRNMAGRESDADCLYENGYKQ